MKIIMKICGLAALLLMLTSCATQAKESDFAKTTGKKLIEYGWDRPSPEFVRDHIRTMEEQPFEGIIMKLPNNGGAVFNPKNWDKNKGQLQDQLKVLSSIKWNKFTDNFIAMYAASDMDWYSDADWTKILENVQFVAKAGKAGKCVGLMFDPEPYGTNPWKYSTLKDTDKHSFEEYSQKVYQRGQQFMQAMQKEMPQVKLIVLHGYSMFYDYSHDANYKKRMSVYSKQTYGLLMPFWNGMLDAANQGSQLIDGNESSYYYQTPKEFTDAYTKMREGSAINVPDALKAKFKETERAAYAIYPDHLFGLRPKKKIISDDMPPSDQKKWLEQNVYYALKTTDEYVWFYGQHMNWWNTEGDPGVLKAIKNQNVPAVIKDTVISAKAKLMQGQDIGFDTSSIFDAAKEVQFRELKDLKAPAEGAPRKGNADIYTHSSFVFLQYAKQGESVTIDVRAKKVYARETQLELHDPSGKLLKTYTIPYDDKVHPITFVADQTGIYRLVRNQIFSQRIDVNSSLPGNGYYVKTGGAFLPTPGGKLYFEVPAGVDKFTVDVSCPSKKNYANIALLDAQGKTVDQHALSKEKPYKFSVSRSDASKAEIWAINISNANWGVDIKLDKSLPQVLSTNPDTLLIRK